MLRELDHFVGQQGERPARAAFGRRGAGGRDQESFLLARELARGAGARLLAQRGVQIAFDKAAFGPVHR